MKIIFTKFRIAYIAFLVVFVVGQALPVLAKQTSKQVDVYFVPMQFMFDDTQLVPPSDQLGFIYKNSTYVPMRFISYALDKTVNWDPATYTVSVSQPNEDEQTKIDAFKKDREVAQAQLKPIDSSILVTSGIKVYEEKVSYVFDGKAKMTKEGLSGLIYKDRLYVPLRFFSEAVGQKIDWDAKTYTVMVQTVSLSVPDPVDSKPTASPTPTIVPAETPELDLPGGPIGGAVGPAVKPTEAELKSAAEASMNALKARANQEFNALLLEASGRLAKGRLMLQGFDAQFAAIINSLQSQLISNGYDTSSIAAYQQAYANESSFARSLFGT